MLKMIMYNQIASQVDNACKPKTPEESGNIIYARKLDVFLSFARRARMRVYFLVRYHSNTRDVGLYWRTAS